MHGYTKSEPVKFEIQNGKFDRIHVDLVGPLLTLSVKEYNLSSQKGFRSYENFSVGIEFVHKSLNECSLFVYRIFFVRIHWKRSIVGSPICNEQCIDPLWWIII